MMQYQPEPPFNAGTPETAGEEIVQPFIEFGQLMIDSFLAQTQETAKQLYLNN